MRTTILRAVMASCAALAVGGCGDDTTSSSGGGDMAMTLQCTGAPVAGAQDMHCYSDAGNLFVSVDEAQCTVDAGTDSGDPGASDFGDTMYNTSGNDDDCKYSVSYVVTSGGICENEDTYFTVTLKNAIAGTPVLNGTANGSMFRAEVFLTDTHPANTSKSTTVDMGGGVYKVGPIQFDAAGQWTVRFHFFENCTDTPTSPHGHAAFFVKVP